MQDTFDAASPSAILTKAGNIQEGPVGSTIEDLHFPGEVMRYDARLWIMQILGMPLASGKKGMSVLRPSLSCPSPNRSDHLGIAPRALYPNYWLKPHHHAGQHGKASLTQRDLE
jgi:hypothetical protein